MSYTDNSIQVLHSAIAHAIYEGFSTFEYETRDWSNRKEMVMKTETRKHSEYEMEVFGMFSQLWGSTALGFGGIGGAAMTTAYTTILKSKVIDEYCVYFNGRFAYNISNPNSIFFEDIAKRFMKSVKNSQEYIEKNE